MAAFWSSLSALSGQALYVWAAIIGLLVFIVAELVLLELRRRSIMGHLGEFRPDDPKQGNVSKPTSAAGGSKTGDNK